MFASEDALMWPGAIVGCPGASGPARRGSTPAQGLRIEGVDGRVLDVRQGPREVDTAQAVTVVREIGYYAFDRCPICLMPGPTSCEHVPPASFGGQVRTLVCEPCNHRLGRSLEPELLDWRDTAFRNARASAAAVRGRRKLPPRVFFRETPEGEFVLILGGAVDPAVLDMFVSGTFNLVYRPPDRNRYKLAALKHAYLAECLNRREIPETPSAVVIRRDLLAARDASSPRGVPSSEYAGAMPLMRSYQPPSGPPLGIALVSVGETDGAHEVWISLAGTVCVPWPMPDVKPLV